MQFTHEELEILMVALKAIMPGSCHIDINSPVDASITNRIPKLLVKIKEIIKK